MKRHFCKEVLKLFLAQSDPSSSTLRKPNCILAWCAFHVHYGQRLGRYLEGMAKVEPFFSAPLEILWPSSSTSRMQPDPLEWQSYLAFRPVCSRTHPWLSDSWKDTRIWIRAVSGDSFHFINKTFIRAHTFAKTGHFLTISWNVKEYGYCRLKGR